MMEAKPIGNLSASAGALARGRDRRYGGAGRGRGPSDGETCAHVYASAGL
jgi:hypothetical protein